MADVVDFRQRLFETLRRSGTVDKIRAELRSRLIGELQLQTNVSIANASDGPEGQRQRSVLARAIDSLVLDYLRRHGHDYSVSVFLPECGLSGDQQVLSHADILQVLRLNERTDLLGGHSFDGGSLLDQLVTVLSTKLGTKHDKTMQTSEDPLESMQNKLRAIDEQYLAHREDDEKNTHAALEERMVQFERECEQRVKLDAEEQLAHWKETELARIRAEEQMHFHEELEKMRESYEREHKVRREQAVALEQKLKEKLQRKLSDIESGNYQERQKLLQEYEAFRHKEAHMKKEMELNERTMQLERERVQREIEAAHARVMDADRAKDQLAVKLREEMDRYQMDFDREHASLLATLQADKLKLDTERALLQERQQQLEQRLQNTGTLETDLVREREAKHALQVETAAVRRELELLKESNIQLRSAHDAMQSLGKFNGERVAVDTQHNQEKEHALLIKSQENAALQQRLSDSAKSVSKYKKVALRWQKECQDLIGRLEPLAHRNEELESQIDEDTMRIKELQREIAQLRLSLYRAQMSAPSDFARMSLHGLDEALRQSNISDKRFRATEPLQTDLAVHRAILPDVHVNSLNNLPQVHPQVHSLFERKSTERHGVSDVENVPPVPSGGYLKAESVASFAALATLPSTDNVLRAMETKDHPTVDIATTVPAFGLSENISNPNLRSMSELDTKMDRVEPMFGLPSSEYSEPAKKAPYETELQPSYKEPPIYESEVAMAAYEDVPAVESTANASNENKTAFQYTPISADEEQNEQAPLAAFEQPPTATFEELPAAEQHVSQAPDFGYPPPSSNTDNDTLNKYIMPSAAEDFGEATDTTAKVDIVEAVPLYENDFVDEDVVTDEQIAKAPVSANTNTLDVLAADPDLQKYIERVMEKREQSQVDVAQVTHNDDTPVEVVEEDIVEDFEFERHTATPPSVISDNETW